MKLKKLKVDLIKLPATIEILLFLIREDLKAHKLLNSLNEIGCSDSPFFSDLSSLVLASAGIADKSEETYNFYFDLMEKYSNKINGDQDQLMQQTLKVYVKLMSKKKEIVK